MLRFFLENLSLLCVALAIKIALHFPRASNLLFMIMYWFLLQRGVQKRIGEWTMWMDRWNQGKQINIFSIFKILKSKNSGFQLSRSQNDWKANPGCPHGHLL